MAYHPFVGGAEIAVKEITDRIKDIEFHLITVNLDGKQKKEESIGNIRVHRVGSGKFGKYLFPFLGVQKGLALHKTHNFSAVWSIMANYAGFAALFFKYLRPRVPFILTLQEGDPIGHIKRRVWFVYPFFVQIFRRADRIQAISNYLADFARSMRASAPILVIPNGVDVFLFGRELSPREIQDIKEDFDKEDGDVFLITVSRLVLKNGIADVIKALPLMPRRVRFLILGEGPLEAELKKLSRNLGMESRVIFLGFVNQTEIPKYLKISDIFVRPSLSEGMGNSFIEAMAAGIPVIATPVGGIPDFLKDASAGSINLSQTIFPNSEKATGIFCEAGNPRSIAEKVGQLLNDRTLAMNLALNARDLVVEKYDWNQVAKNMSKMVFLAK